MDQYHYSEATNEYLASSRAELDPLESKKAEKSVYLNVPHATLNRPPKVGLNEVPIYADGGWVVVKDYRGKSVYSIADRKELVVSELGEIPDGYTELSPDKFDYWNGLRWIKNKAEELSDCKVKRLLGLHGETKFALSAITDSYPADERLSWGKQEAEARSWLQDSEVKTPLLDGIVSEREIQKSDLVALIIGKADEFALISGQVFGRRQSLEAMINEAETIEDVEAIKWSL